MPSENPGAFRLAELSLSPSLVEAMHQVTCAFFELPFEVKAGYRYVEDQYVGWCGGEFLGLYGSADHKEMYHIGPRVAPTLVAHGSDGSVPPGDCAPAALASCSLWPEAPEEFVAIWHDYYRAMQEASASWVLAISWDPTRRGSTSSAAIGPTWRPTTTRLSRGRGCAPFTTHLTATSPSSRSSIRTKAAGGLSVQSADGNWHAIDPHQTATSSTWANCSPT